MESQNCGRDTNVELVKQGKIEFFVVVFGRDFGVGNWALCVDPITLLSGRLTEVPLSC